MGHVTKKGPFKWPESVSYQKKDGPAYPSFGMTPTHAMIREADMVRVRKINYDGA